MLKFLQDVPKAFKNKKLSIFLFAALAVQILYWYLGSPGPSLLNNNFERSLTSASINIGWSLLLFFIITFIFYIILGLPVKSLGLKLGNARFGFMVIGIASIVAIILMFFGANDASIQATYPWSGLWLGKSFTNILLWIPLYALYYLSFEFFYRGFLLRGLETFWNLETALWIQVLCSVLIHVGKPLTETLAAVPAAFMFAALAIRSRSLLYPILLHLFIGLSNDIFSLYHQGLLLP